MEFLTNRFLSEQVNDQERPWSRDDDAQQALDDSVYVVNFEPHNRMDILQAFHELEYSIIDELQRQLNIHRNVRGYISLNATYSRIGPQGERLEHQAVFRTQMLVFANEDDIDRNLAEMMREIFDHSQEFEAQGSGWTLDEVFFASTTCCQVQAANSKLLHSYT